MTELLPANARQSRALPDPIAEPTIRADRAAAILDISSRAVLYAVERGEIPAVRVGRAVRILTAQFLTRYGLTEQASDQSAA
jgi:excisionase family DNA binding protein